ncbi:MAG: BrnT family toxin [Candidatus Poribacteria bacterium]|nr:BrnT family toxin [Candidatus Poribacteria bacterium]
MRYSFEWHVEKEKQNRRRHRISFVQATTVFQDPNQVTTFDEDHSDAEDRWITLGFDKNGILLVVIHTVEETERYMNIRIISARKATRAETKQYEEFNQ